MRLLFYNHFGIPHQEKQTILIMQERHSRGSSYAMQFRNIANIPQIVKMIKEEFPIYYNVEIISWEDYSLKQQIQIMARTKLMISLPGSGIMNAFLLQDDSALFCYCQKAQEQSIDLLSIYVNGTKMEGAMEFQLWFNHFDYASFKEFCGPFITLTEEGATSINVVELKKSMH